MLWNAFGAMSAQTLPCFSSSANEASGGDTGGLTTATPPSTGKASASAMPGPNVYLNVRTGSEGSAAIQVAGMGRGNTPASAPPWLGDELRKKLGHPGAVAPAAGIAGWAALATRGDRPSNTPMRWSARLRSLLAH